MPHSTPPRLLVVAHGTRSATGSATTHALLAAVAGARPELHVDLCFLDVNTPTLTEALDATAAPTVVVPLLLSTGYHVQHDIPEALHGRTQTVVARHLGPHPLLAEALAHRLAEASAAPAAAASTLLVGAGSSREEAATELADMATLLAERISRPVVAATMADDLRGALAALPKPADVATYLLAPGQFTQNLVDAVGDRAAVAQPIGVHPALVELVLLRYDESVRPA